MKRQVADRLLMTMVSITVVAISQLEPQSISFFMVQSGGVAALLCMGFLFVTAVIALVDTVVNDMLPPRFTLQVALGVRRGIWMSIAITYAGIVFVALKSDLSWSAAIFYILFSARCAGISFLDLYYEYADVVKDPSTPISTTISGALGDE